MTTPADELRTAAEKIRDLATRTNTTLERNDIQWTDLTVSDKAYRATASPMVWSQYAATTHPGVGLALAEWLEHEAAGHEAVQSLGDLTSELLIEMEQVESEARFVHSTLPQALAVARAINGTA